MVTLNPPQSALRPLTVTGLFQWSPQPPDVVRDLWQSPYWLPGNYKCSGIKGFEMFGTRNSLDIDNIVTDAHDMEGMVLSYRSLFLVNYRSSSCHARKWWDLNLHQPASQLASLNFLTTWDIFPLCRPTPTHPSAQITPRYLAHFSCKSYKL